MRGRGVIVFCALLAAACAEVGRPPGGPVDETPPRLATVSPGSLATGVDLQAPLVFEFSERVDRRRFSRSLIIVPDRALEDPKFDDTTVRVRPRRGWPADTTVVWVLLPSLPDKHGVAMGTGSSGAFTSGSSLPPGRITGTVTVDSLVKLPETGPDWSRLRVRLTLDPLEGQRNRRPWRFFDGSEDGSFVLQWLALPSGPYQLSAWLDKNQDSRRDEREPVATVDSLFLGPADSMLQIDPARLRLIDLEGPVPVDFCVDSVAVDSIAVVVWTWAEAATEPARSSLDSTGCLRVELAPGQVRWGAWLDLDGDLGWSRTEDGTSEPFLFPDTLEVQPAVPDRRTLPWPLERLPWSAVDTLDVPPVPDELWSPSSS